MKIALLANFPEYVDVVAEIVYNEFVLNSRSKKTLDEVRDFFLNTQENRLPLTLIALDGSECAGTVSIFENDLTERKLYKPWLASLCIKPEHRRKGIAEQLVAETTKLAGKLGYPKLYLRTEDASSYYMARGWVLVESLDSEPGDKVDVFVMET